MNELKKLIALEIDARKFGFDWPNHEAIFKQVIEEVNEIKEDMQLKASEEKIQEEIGDLLHAAISLCIFSGYDVNDTLLKVNHKFETRMSCIKQAANSLGLTDLCGQTDEFKMALWKKSKEVQP